MRLANARRRYAMQAARQRGTHTDEEWLEVLVAFEFQCARCGVRHCDSPLTKDHVVPVSAGGSDGIDNLQPLCQPCNSLKGISFMDFRHARAA